MQDSFVNAGIVAVIYLLFKFAHMRLVLKELKPIKDLVFDAMIVYLSALSAFYVIDQVATPTSKVKFESTKAFVDAPEF
jgi:hypothetical protein